MEDVPEETTRRSIREEISDLRDLVKYGQDSDETNKKRKGWKMPRGWKGKIKAAKKETNKVLVFYFNMKGRLEKPKLLPVLPGDIVMIKNKAHDASPMHLWSLGKKGPKVLAIREIDRIPVSNLDYEDIKQRGSSTDSDEILIKATMRAIQAGSMKPMNKTAIIIVVIAIIGLLAFVFTSGG